jgi:hypothetical protein
LSGRLPGTNGGIEFFDALTNLGPQDLYLKSLLTALDTNRLGNGKYEPRHIISKLIEFIERDRIDTGGEMIGALRRFAPTVRRHSF